MKIPFSLPLMHKISKNGRLISFVYYIKVPENSSSICFARDPNDSDTWTSVPVEKGHCLVWEKELPHSVAPSDHAGRCVLSGNLR